MLSTLAETKKNNLFDQKKLTLKMEDTNLSFYVWRIIWQA